MVKLNKIYTRTGDDGSTGLVDGSRTAKHAARIEAIGAVDEANSAIGLAVLAAVESAAKSAAEAAGVAIAGAVAREEAAKKRSRSAAVSATLA